MNIDDCLQLQRDLPELEKWTKMASGVQSIKMQISQQKISHKF